jgi:hypothetical protein
MPTTPPAPPRNVNFNTSKTYRWETSSKHCHLNWVILDSDWEAEFCRVAESPPAVLAYVKNHNLGLEVPYRFGSETRKYLPDFIVLVDDGHGPDDPLHLVVEIKGYRGEDAKEKKSTMDTYWVPGVNHLGSYGRWAFAEFTEVYQIEADFKAKIDAEFNKIDRAAATKAAQGTLSMATRITPRPSKPQARRGQAQEHPFGRAAVGVQQEQQHPSRSATRAIPTWTRSWSGAARTSRTGATWWSTRRRSTSRKRSTPRC